MKTEKIVNTAIFIAVLAALFAPAAAWAEDNPLNRKFDREIIENTQDFLLQEKPSLLFADAPILKLRQNKFASSHFSGLNMDDLILDLLYPSSGRLKYVQYIPRFGKNKMYYRALEWKNYETDHISLFSYDERMKDSFIAVLEETYNDFAGIFRTESFDEKLRIYIYRDRRDFSQMNFGGIDPDSIGGVTHDLRKWHNKIAFLFEGSKSEFYEVARHEMTHRFNMEQIYFQSGQDMLLNPPLWFVEGLAISTSIGWSALYEWIARDAYYNDYLDLGIYPEGWGTIMPYVTGGMMLNYIKENYGITAVNAIIKDSAAFAGNKFSKTEEFDAILLRYTKLDTTEIYLKTAEKFKNRLSKSPTDIDVRSPVVATGRILAARKNFLMRAEGKYLNEKLYLAYLENNKIKKEKSIVSDNKNGVDRLEFAADVSDTRLAYVVFRSYKGRDVLRIVPHSLKKGKITLGKTKEYVFPGIVFITSPTFVSEKEVAFVGLKNGFTNIYLFNLETKKLDQLTDSESHIWGIDYSPTRGEIVFSRESDKRTDNPNKCDFNYDLYLLNLKTKKAEKVVETVADEFGPQWLDDSKIIFTTSSYGTFGISIYDLKAKRILPAGSVRIVASSPKVLNAKTVLFNTTNFLEHQIRLLELPSSPPAPAYTSKKSASSVNDKSADDEYLGNLAVKNGKLFVFAANGKNFYPVKKFAVTETNLYFEAETAPGAVTLVKFLPGMPKTKSAESATAKSEIEKFYEEHAVMWQGASNDGLYLAFVANNRLKWSSVENPKKFPLSVYIYNLTSPDQIVITKYDLAMKSTSGFIRAKFAGNYFLVELQEKILLHNLAAGSSVFETVGVLKISPDNTFIARVEKVNSLSLRGSKNRLLVLNTSTCKSTNIGEFNAINNLHFNADNELVWSETKGRRRKDLAAHIYIWSPETLTIIKIRRDKKATLDINKKTIKEWEASSKIGAVFLVEGEDGGKRKIYLAKISGNNVVSLPLGNLTVTAFETLIGNALFIKATENQKKKSLIYDLDKNEIKERAVVDYADIEKPYLAIQSKKNLTVYNSLTGKNKAFKDTAGFWLGEESLIFSQWTDTDYDLFEMNLDSFESAKLTDTPSRDETNPRLENGKLNYVIQPIYSGEKVTYLPDPPSPSVGKSKIEKRKIKKAPLDAAEGFGLASISYGMGGFRFLGYLNLNLYDIFEDGLMNIYYFGGYNTGFQYGEISYLHRPSGNGIRAYIHQYGDDCMTGLGYLHSFRLSKFQRINIGWGYKFQWFASHTPGDYRGLGSVVETNVSYTLDTSLHLLHGPQSGYRFFVGTSAGYNIDGNALNNTDFNFAWRQYFNVKNFVSFAYRLEGGSSFGIVPTWFGLGGNMSMRGLPLFSQWGNIYALAGAEVRLDLFYYAGAVFKEPLTPVSIFTLAILPQFGWYADVGTVFYYNPLLDYPGLNDEEDRVLRHILEDLRYPPDLHWSTGPFVNLPYLPLGMIMRFNWAVAGTDKYWNFWFGFNW